MRATCATTDTTSSRGRRTRAAGPGSSRTFQRLEHVRWDVGAGQPAAPRGRRAFPAECFGRRGARRSRSGRRPCSTRLEPERGRRSAGGHPADRARPHGRARPRAVHPAAAAAARRAELGSGRDRDASDSASFCSRSRHPGPRPLATAARCLAGRARRRLVMEVCRPDHRARVRRADRMRHRRKRSGRPGRGRGVPRGNIRCGMTTPLLELDRVSVSYGGMRALSDVSLVVPEAASLPCSAPTARARRPRCAPSPGWCAPSGGHDQVPWSRTSDAPRHTGSPPWASLHVPEGRGIFRSLTVSENLEMAEYAPRRQVRWRGGRAGRRAVPSTRKPPPSARRHAVRR